MTFYFISVKVLPLRPSLRKQKSVTFEESIDEVDGRKRARSLGDVYDIPRKQSSLMDLCAQSVKITPHDVATYATIQKPAFHTFPRKNLSRKQSLEHIYDEIPIKSITAEDATLKSDDLTTAPDLYENQESIEKTKM